MTTSYGQFCPVAQAAEVLCARWTPLIVRELLYGTRAFGDLTEAIPLMSRSLLIRRLRELEHLGIVEWTPHPSRRSKVYRLTDAGKALHAIISGMSDWAQRWIAPALPADVRNIDPRALMWALRSNLLGHEAPKPSFLMRFEFRGLAIAESRQRYWWLLLRNGDIEVCAKEPHHDVDVVISADIATFANVWMGHEKCSVAESEQRLSLAGDVRAKLAAKRMLSLSDSLEKRSFMQHPDRDLATDSTNQPTSK